jgi:putative FmdB family regulatory protein
VAGEKNYTRMKGAVMEIVQQHFRPEFINRIDDIVVFHPLGTEQIRAIVDIQLGYAAQAPARADIDLVLDDAARDLLGEAGFDPVYGARPLKRAIQQPFYEYECSSCKYYTEVLQKLSDPPLRKCPSCGKSSFKKLVSAPVFRLKGSGWYETDFKGDKDNKRNLAGDESKPPEAADKDKAAKGDTDAKAGKEPVAKAEPAKAESAKPAAEKPSAAAKSPARSRRGAPAARPKAAPAKAAKKKSRR